IERVWSTDTTLRFYRDQDEVYAQDYLWLLQSIGFQRSQIELITYDQDTPVRTQRYWRKVLGIKASFLQQAPESKSVTNHRLGIRVTLRRGEGDGAYTRDLDCGISYWRPQSTGISESEPHSGWPGISASRALTPN